jgi:DeoR/GlpR family transcriptional regulator of sugar metabolism
MRELAAFPHQRQEAILAALARQGRVVAAELADLLGVSDDTVRRDLDELAAAGRLRRVRGGALPAAPDNPVRLDDRRGLHPAEKARIAKRVAALLADETVLSLAGGTTVEAVARELAGDGRARTILTTSVDVAVVLAEAPGEVLLAGGHLEPASRTTVGADALDAVRRVRAGVAVLGVCSLHPAAGLTTNHAGEAEVLRAMAACADRVLVGAEAAKIGTASAHVVAPAADVDTLVTDSDEPAEDLRALRDLGVEVVVA